MKIMKTVTIPAVTRQEVAEMICDLCKSPYDDRDDDLAWDEITIQRARWKSYSSDAKSGETISVDLCGNCFEKRLIPWLEGQGVVPTVTDTSY